MKKSLSLLVAIAMVFSMFASVAFAADETTTTATEKTTLDKFNELKEAGVFTGYPGGGAGLENDMTRAEFAKVLAKVADLKDNAAAAKIYTDVAATHWAVGQIGSVTEAKFMNGIAANKFGPTGKVTLEMVAKIATLVAGVSQIDKAVTGTVSPWAKGYVAAAIEAGLLPQVANYQANATRGTLVDVAYDLYAAAHNKITVKSTKVVDSKNIEVTFSDDLTEKVTLETALVTGVATDVKVTHAGVVYTVSVKFEGLAATAKQLGKNSITVTFNRALTADEVKAATFALTSDGSTFKTTQVWSADNTSVVLTVSYLPTGTYSLVVNALAPIALTIVDEIPTKLEITATALQQAAGQTVAPVVYNQFGAAIADADVSVTLVDATTGATVSADTDGKFNLSVTDSVTLAPIYKVGDTFVATAVFGTSGLSATKTFKLAAGSAATVLKFDAVKPLEGDTHITTSKSGYVLPYTFTDQYGAAVKLPLTTTAQNGKLTLDRKATIGGITFIVSDASIISELFVDKNGVLTFATGTQSGTAVLSAVNPTTGATATTSIIVNSAAAVAKLALSKPATAVVAGEEIIIPYKATDNYGVAIANTSADITNVTWSSNVPFVGGYPKLNAKGELVFKFAAVGGKTPAYVYAYVNGALAGNITLDVNTPPTIKALNDISGVVNYMTPTAVQDFKGGNITYTDSLNRVKDVDLANVTITPVSAAPLTSPTVTYAAGKITATGTSGVTTITVKLFTDNTKTTLIGTKTIDVEVVPVSSVTSYSINAVGTVFGNGKFTDLDDAKNIVVSGFQGFSKTVSVTGKLANGKDVVIVQGTSLNSLSSSDTAVLAVEGNEVYGVDAGTATLTAYGPTGKVLGTQVITVSKATPVTTTVAFNESTYSDAGQVEFLFNDSDNKVTVKDQYGTEVYYTANTQYAVTSSDSKLVVTKYTDGFVVKKDVNAPAGAVTATITFRASNGVSASAVVTVN